MFPLDEGIIAVISVKHTYWQRKAKFGQEDRNTVSHFEMNLFLKYTMKF